jgi:hypothetical protein
MRHEEQKVKKSFSTVTHQLNVLPFSSEGIDEERSSEQYETRHNVLFVSFQNAVCVLKRNNNEQMAPAHHHRLCYRVLRPIRSDHHHQDEHRQHERDAHDEQKLNEPLNVGPEWV